ncbi:hypothetical protein SAMN05421770_102130 [Granulicella rosea]|uniref:DUF1731 domain-containing protein n=1 Tax=Granulicella rosea TaxID=474952 RepID=A0A239GXG7_9BACT|nr:TIGR01777 family oxidoreductase [Granulicella rosea]SNS73850.1 hypothetical protein SAMN05421770_102130 [Granulicella rosea]
MTSKKRILIPGGSGQIGTILARYLYTAGHDVTVLSRRPVAAPWTTRRWDGLTLEPSWTRSLEGLDAVIHMSGRSVDCRYTARNRREILDSRVQPTLLLGHAIERCADPPKLWMNASTSTFYRHTLNGPDDHPQDEFTGEPGGSETGVPETWNFSVDVASHWEKAFYASNTPATRKIALRSSMTMSPDRGGVFRVLLGLVRMGLGGTEGPGDQYVSWIHDHDYCGAIDFLIRHPEISGPVNLTAPQPLPNRDFLRDLREAAGVPIGLPASRWMLEIGAFLMRTETELILKSRRAVPTVLLQHGFKFGFPAWPDAARDLVSRTRNADLL